MSRLRVTVLLLGAFALGTLTFNLGQWQTRRAEEKQALEIQREAALVADVLTPTSATLPDVSGFRFRRVRLQGAFIPGAWVALDNRLIAGRPAVSVVQAFRVHPAGFVVAVDRGLLPRNPADPRALPAVPEIDQTVTIEGFFLERFARTAELWGLRVADASQIHRNGREWSNFNASDFELEYREQLGRPSPDAPVLANYVVQQTGPSSEGFVRNPPQWSSDVSKHRGYAFQWYSLTVVLVIMVGVLVWRERKVVEAATKSSTA